MDGSSRHSLDCAEFNGSDDLSKQNGIFHENWQLGRALSDSQTIVELAPEDAMSVAKREVIQGMLGDSDSAIKDLLKALE